MKQSLVASQCMLANRRGLSIVLFVGQARRDSIPLTGIKRLLDRSKHQGYPGHVSCNCSCSIAPADFPTCICCSLRGLIAINSELEVQQQVVTCSVSHLLMQLPHVTRSGHCRMRCCLVHRTAWAGPCADWVSAVLHE